MQSVERGKEIHAEATKKGLSRNNLMLATALIDMYAKCGELAAAKIVSEQLPKRDVVSWTALIAGYVRHGFCDEALNFFSQMKSEGLVPNNVTFSCILKACSSRRSIKLGQEIHAEVEKQGLLEKDVVLGTTLVDMYGKCGMLHKAQQVFDRLPVRNVVSWTALIVGYVQHELGDEALASFVQMRREGFSPDATAFACVLKACGNLRRIDKGEEIHREIAELGLLEGDIVLRTALIDMYAKCGAIGKAQQAFDEIATPNVVCWNALIAGYVEHELAAEALRCFMRMRAMGPSPDAFTFACILKACGRSGSVEKGQEIHAELRKQGLLGKDQVLGNALVDMYARCGLIIEAQEAFDELPAQDAVAWNVLISGYTQRGLYDEALSCFQQMQENNLPPDEVTFACVLKACGSSGSARKGKEIHAELNLRCFLGRNAELGTALMDMYAMCGMIGEAEEMFEELPVRDTVSWNVLLSGYAQLGRAKRVLDTWKKMLENGSMPDAVTFVVLLSACSLSGLVEEGQICFSAMDSVYSFAPSLEHCACMVKLFGHLGQLGRAVMVIETVREADRVHLWSALIGSCQKSAYLDVGRWAFEQLLQLDRDNPVAYVCMSNMYAFTAMQSEQ
jgi:pentatricopeptide repeat protein